MSSKGNNTKRDFTSVLGSLKTTTQLLGIAILVVESALIYVALNLEGKDRVIIILAVLAILALTVIGAVYLESLRIRLSNNITQPNNKDQKQALQYRYEVFISAPMDAYNKSEQEQKQHRNNILDIKRALKEECKLEPVFYAGTDIANREAFQQSAVALRENYQELKASQKFILIYPAQFASSILVETGMALALKKDCVFFVKDGIELPYLIRDASNVSQENGLPKIRIYEYKKFSDILRWIRRDKGDLF